MKYIRAMEFSIDHLDEQFTIEETQRMEAQKSQHEKQQSPSASVPEYSSCRKNKRDDATFLGDLKDHIDEFMNASVEEHKYCFKKSFIKLFGITKIVAQKSTDAKEVESSLPLQTTVAD